MNPKIFEAVREIIEKNLKCMAYSGIPGGIRVEGVEDVAKSIAEAVPEKRKGIEIKGAIVKCQFPDDCNFPICDCAEGIPTKNRYKTQEDRGHNAFHDTLLKNLKNGGKRK